ncbi:hypothetical protein AKJ65_05675 [candidate division MSBL1 archaeon SCGC-AAA259E19]|uniref:Type II methyltransferase M.Eco57I C-terminal domain-containing protein n=1 Tax=candidate division MSBL1 archaeon SCGC-AAA259E19 TaxID=1698264 RepID=A0A133UIM5_9EURY|nr:hypothetical protein AKJ65_05675 [candidate division MSBL1 archaeon SCGC-AAA259E19]
MTKKNYITKVVKVEELDFQKNWSSYLYRKKIGIEDKRMIKFSEIGRLKRGIATGNNEFFTLTKEEAKKRKILNHTETILRTSKHLKGFSFSSSRIKELEEDGVPTELLYIDENTEITPELEDYLEEGKEKGVQNSYLCKNRNPWYEVERRTPPSAFVTYMGRGEPRFILNEAKSLYLNNCHGLYLNEDIGKERLKSLLLFLNSFFDREYIRGYTKNYSGGLFKIEPSDLEDTKILDVFSLSRNKIKKLAKRFDSLESNVQRDKMKKEIKGII